MIELTPDEAETVHTFLCEFRNAWMWKTDGGIERNAAAYYELADCIRWMEAKIYADDYPNGLPDTSGIPSGERHRALYHEKYRGPTAEELGRSPITDIKVGDTVRHRPSGETWTVVRIEGDRVYVYGYGWQRSSARLSDCDLVEVPT